MIMKTLKILVAFFFLIAFAGSVYSQGNKVSWTESMDLDETIAPIECIGQYTGELVMNLTWFYTGKVLNKASGLIEDSNGNLYTIESLFNCHLFVRNFSASGNSNQSWTYRVRSVETGKLVAVVHFTFHYENYDGEDEGAFFINYHSSDCK